MIPNFAEIERQLKALSPVINSFKSEAVQLRIVELILGHEIDSPEADPPQVPALKAIRRRRRKAVSPETTTDNPTAEKGARKRRTAGRGPIALLQALVDEGFFKSARTIHAITTHMSEALATKTKPNEISGKLGRLTKDKVLKRTKNSNGQYEYLKA